MVEKGLNGYSENIKKVLKDSGLSVEKLKNEGREKTFIEIKRIATDKEAVEFIEELFKTKLAYKEIIEFIRSCAHPNGT